MLLLNSFILVIFSFTLRNVKNFSVKGYVFDEDNVDMDLLAKDIFKEIALDFDKGEGYNEKKVRVDLKWKYNQVMYGFGGGYTDTSAFLLNKIKETRGEDVYKAVIDRLFKDLGLSYMRLVEGSSDFVSTKQYYSYQDDRSQPFSIAHDEEYIIPILKDILDANPDMTLLASPWSAPGWMKSGGSLVGGEVKDFDNWAEYLFNYLDAYKNAISREIDMITLQNEPYYNQASYPCSYVDQPKFVHTIKSSPRYKDHQSTKIFSHDHNWSLLDDAEQVVEDIFNQGDSIDGVAWHAYEGDRQSQLRLAEKFPELETIFSEICAWENDRSYHRDLRWCMQNILIGTTRHRATAVAYWNLLLDDNHGPTPRPGSLAWGLVTFNSSNDVKIEAELVCVAHFSAFVSKGYERVSSETYINGKAADIDSPTQQQKDQTPDGPLESVAFSNDDGKVVVVVMNPSWVNEVTFDVVVAGSFTNFTLGKESAATFVFSP